MIDRYFAELCTRALWGAAEKDPRLIAYVGRTVETRPYQFERWWNRVDKLTKAVAHRVLPAHWETLPLPAPVRKVMFAIREEPKPFYDYEIPDLVKRRFIEAGAEEHPVSVGGFRFMMLVYEGVMVAITAARKTGSSFGAQHYTRALYPYFDREPQRYQVGPIYLSSKAFPEKMAEAATLAHEAFETAGGDMAHFYQGLGASGQCAICHATLTDELSKARGIGPECWKGMGAGWVAAVKAKERRESIEKLKAKKNPVRTMPALWDSVVEEVRAGEKGGRAGEWSARKAQRAVTLYKMRGGGYEGEKAPANSLVRWTEQQWRTRSGKPSLETGERYLPASAILALSPEQYAATTRAKREGMRQGKQFVPQPYKIARLTKAYRNPTFFHGTSRWEGPAEIREQKKGHAEYGTGIYGTTEWNTATRYGRSVQVIQTRPLRYLEDASLPLADTLAWLQEQRIGFGIKREIADMLTHRAVDGHFPAYYLVNLIVSEGYGYGKVGLSLTEYLVSKGIEASRINQRGEDWIVIFDPRVITSVKKADTKAPDFSCTLPRLAQQDLNVPGKPVRNPRRNPDKMTLEQAAIAVRMIRAPRLRLKPATFEEQLVSTMLDQWEARGEKFPKLPKQGSGINSYMQASWMPDFLRLEVYPIILPYIEKLIAENMSTEGTLVSQNEQYQSIPMIPQAVREWIAGNAQHLAQARHLAASITRWASGRIATTIIGWASSDANANEEMDEWRGDTLWLFEALKYLTSSIETLTKGGDKPDIRLTANHADKALEAALNGLGDEGDLMLDAAHEQIDRRLDAWVVWQHDKGKAR